MRKGQRGFSLIELLVVVAIILTIAAIAIPNLLRSRISANETAAVSNLRTISTSLTIYATMYPQCGYPNSLKALQPGTPPSPTAAALLDAIMAQDVFLKSGYNYTYLLTGGVGDCSGTPGNDFEIEARPAAPYRTGQRGFYVDTTLVIRQDPAGDADATSVPIG